MRETIELLGRNAGFATFDDILREYRHGHLRGTVELDQLRRLVETIT